MAERKFHWLKLKDDFFDEKYIKALRKLPDGDALVIIYLKLQLKSLKTEGIIKYEHIMPNVSSELSLMLDEDENKVKLALNAVVGMGIAELWDDETLYLSAMQELIGSESSSAMRVRRHREQKKLSNTDNEALQCNADVTQCNKNVTQRREEKRRDREEIEKNIYSPIISFLNEKAGTNYRSSSAKTKTLIKARAEEGFTLDDFKTVIEKKCAEWLNTPMEKYLRPETLFGTKFEGYLNARVNVKTNANTGMDESDIDSLDDVF